MWRFTLLWATGQAAGALHSILGHIPFERVRGCDQQDNINAIIVSSWCCNHVPVYGNFVALLGSKFERGWASSMLAVLHVQSF